MRSVFFCGYPIEDVKGFRSSEAVTARCVVYWKVYDDVEQARRILTAMISAGVYCGADPCWGIRFYRLLV